MNQKFTAEVIGLKASKTAKVEIVRDKLHPKYHKPLRIRSTKQVHYEEKEFSLKVGDKVEIESRPPLSKIKRFLVIRKLQRK